MSIVIGIDPGMTGAIAAVQGETLLWVEDMPLIAKEISVPLLKEISEYEGDVSVVGIEFVHAMPKQGVASSFKFGKVYGLALGIYGANHRIEDIRPRDWKSEFGLIKKDKDAARLKAIQMWPGHAETFKRKKDIGRADAALIALYTARSVTLHGHNEAA